MDAAAAVDVAAEPEPSGCGGAMAVDGGGAALGSCDDSSGDTEVLESEEGADGQPPSSSAESSKDGDDEEEEEEGEQEEAAAQLASLRQQRAANIQALLEGGAGLAAVTRAPLMAALRVTDADQVLRRPFKSPHPSAPAASDSLKRKLAARRRFVPWGSSKVFTPVAPPRLPPSQDAPPPSSQAAAEAAAALEADQQLPPGVEPLILWDPAAAAAGAASAAVMGGDAAPAGPAGGEGTAIEVDRMLTRWLRPHQREGVAFMFDCVTGLRLPEGRGCILADDMGLGKTLQAITLMWTLLKQGAPALGGRPIARRTVICCPTSLVGNWESECAKWLKGRVRTLALCEASRDEVSDGLRSFLSPAHPYDCLIVSYETLRLHADKLAAAGPGACDLLICDEAHRLKNDQTLTNRALAGIQCARRVLLSGTPMQNHLDEFYAMCSFTNPGVLGSPAEFRRHFESPILAGREPGAPAEMVARAEERSLELSAVVNQFILRRTNRLLSAHLPPKVVMVVCCRLTPLQRDLYAAFLASNAARRVLQRAEGSKRAGAAGVLSAITSLKKLCNHPKLTYDALHSKAAAPGEGDGFECVAALIPPGTFDGGRPGRGGMALGWEALGSKMAVVARLLGVLRAETSDKVVIVSNYTQTLDLFGALCRERGWGSLRLDGSTSIGKRTKLVTKFNDPKGPEFVFLLSSKAGGCGLNLVGANRLVLFDPDWNPANDKQAAGRVWRDGQSKRVYVYRLLSSGTIEEKVFQRQISKEGLQQLVDSAAGGAGGDAKPGGGGGGGGAPEDAFGGGGGGAGDGKGGMGLLSAEQLRELFTLRADVASDTYEALFCGGRRRAGRRAGGARGGAKGRGSGGDEEGEGGGDSSDGWGWGGGEGLGSGDECGGAGGASDGGGSSDEEGCCCCGGGGGVDADEDGEGAGGGALGPDGPAGGYRPQVGAPAEDDLRSFGLHAAAALHTVPDEMLVRAAADDVTFVFSNAIAGKDVAPPPPPAAAAAGGGAARAPGARPALARPGGGAARAIGVSKPAAVAAAAAAAAARPADGPAQGPAQPLGDAASKANAQAAAPKAAAAAAAAAVLKPVPKATAAKGPAHVGAAAAAATAGAGGALAKRPRLAGARVVARPHVVEESGSDDDFV